MALSCASCTTSIDREAASDEADVATTRPSGWQSVAPQSLSKDAPSADVVDAERWLSPLLALAEAVIGEPEAPLAMPRSAVVAARHADASQSLRTPIPLEDDPLEKRLHDLISASREEVLSRTWAMLGEKAQRWTVDEASGGIRLLLAQLLERLSRVQPSGAIASGAAKHARELLRMGFTVTQALQRYGAVRRAVIELAAKDPAIATCELHAVDRCLNDMITQTLAEYSRQRERALAQEAAQSLGSLAHELRNHLSTARLAFHLVEERGAASERATTILGRSLRGMTQVVERSFSEVRLDSGIRRRQRVSVSELVEEIGAAASIEADARGLELTVTPGASHVEFVADRQIVSDVLVNLLQNAFKFTCANGRVQLQAHTTSDRVVIQVEDECGGLPEHQHDRIFRPFGQRNADGRGLGLGLAISRRAVEVNGGRLFVRNRPGVGCVFVIDLPRCASESP